MTPIIDAAGTIAGPLTRAERDLLAFILEVIKS